MTLKQLSLFLLAFFLLSFFTPTEVVAKARKKIGKPSKTAKSKRSTKKGKDSKKKNDKKGKKKSSKDGYEDSEEDEEDEESLILPKKIILFRCPKCYFTRDMPGFCPDDKLDCIEVLPGEEDADILHFDEAERSIAEMDIQFFKNLIARDKAKKNDKKAK